MLLCKGKRQYLLTCKVTRYLILVLHGSIAVQINKVDKLEVNNLFEKNIRKFILHIQCFNCFISTH